MAEHLKVIDITEVSDLEEVRRSEEPRLLRRGDEDLAVVTPLPRPIKVRRRAWRPSEEDLAAFRGAAGGWKDVDTDKLVRDIYESRRISTRPPVDL